MPRKSVRSQASSEYGVKAPVGRARAGRSPTALGLVEKNYFFSLSAPSFKSGNIRLEALMISSNDDALYPMLTIPGAIFVVKSTRSTGNIMTFHLPFILEVRSYIK